MWNLIQICYILRIPELSHMKSKELFWFQLVPPHGMCRPHLCELFGRQQTWSGEGLALFTSRCYAAGTWCALLPHFLILELKWRAEEWKAGWTTRRSLSWISTWLLPIFGPFHFTWAPIRITDTAIESDQVVTSHCRCPNFGASHRLHLESLCRHGHEVSWCPGTKSEPNSARFRQRLEDGGWTLNSLLEHAILTHLLKLPVWMELPLCTNTGCVMLKAAKALVTSIPPVAGIHQ